jgi:PIN domain nuclease of toxin-antitoxin system
MLLDTHSLVWWVNGSNDLSDAAMAAIAAEISSGELCMSSISAWEIALLVAGGRLTLPMPVTEWLARIDEMAPVKSIPVDNDIAVQSVLLPDGFHKDPADRIIVATARKFGAPIITADQKIRGYRHVRTIW